jgi:hypothetical protein
MQPVFRVANALQVVLTTMANQIAKSSGVIQRERKFRGDSLAQTFVFGWLANPQATLDELAQVAASCGAAVRPQAISQRMTDKLADFFKQLLEAALVQVITVDPVSLPLLQRFNGVYVQDSTVIRLPDEFRHDYPGCGGGILGQTNAAIKFQVRMNLGDGQLEGPFPEPGRASDQSSDIQRLPLPPGALRLADLGYFNLSVLSDMNRNDIYWISRIQVHTVVYDAKGRRLDLCRWLAKQKRTTVDVPIQLGSEERLPCRLIAVRCPAEVVRVRVARVKRDAARRGRTPSKAQLDWCHWTILVTNVPSKLLNVSEAITLYRARWQIELLFKLWKQHGLVDESRQGKPHAQLAELYAKLLGLVIQHWLLLVSVWRHSNRSLTKASKAIRQRVTLLISAFRSYLTLESAIAQIVDSLAVSSRINPRKKQPNTYQTLENVELLAYEIS